MGTDGGLFVLPAVAVRMNKGYCREEGPALRGKRIGRINMKHSLTRLRLSWKKSRDQGGKKFG